jgi:RNA polymerase sigma-70 factor (ECF subfamily)
VSLSVSDPAVTFTNDEQLLAGLRANDPTAFSALVRDHGGMVLAVARRIVHNEEDARDVVQDAFLSAFRALPSFDGQSKLSTWLYRIAVNAALMRVRTRSRRPECLIDDLQPQFLADGHQAQPAARWQAPPPDSLERAEAQAAVREAIAQLPEIYRHVILLRDIEELDTEETAAALGVSPSVVKTRLHRARLALRALLDRRFRENS